MFECLVALDQGLDDSVLRKVGQELCERLGDIGGALLGSEVLGALKDADMAFGAHAPIHDLTSKGLLLCHTLVEMEGAEDEHDANAAWQCVVRVAPQPQVPRLRDDKLLPVSRDTGHRTVGLRKLVESLGRTGALWKFDASLAWAFREVCCRRRAFIARGDAWLAGRVVKFVVVLDELPEGRPRRWVLNFCLYNSIQSPRSGTCPLATGHRMV